MSHCGVFSPSMKIVLTWLRSRDFLFVYIIIPLSLYTTFNIDCIIIKVKTRGKMKLLDIYIFLCGVCVLRKDIGIKS